MPESTYISKLLDMYNKRGLRYKILAPVILVSCITLVATTWMAASVASKTIYENLNFRGQSLLDTLASQAEQAVISLDAAKTSAMLTEALKKPGVAYVFLTDASGAVTSQSFGTEIPKGARELCSAGPKPDEAVRAQVGSWSVQDISRQLMQGSLGKIHLGMDLSPVKTQVQGTALMAFLTVFVIMGAGILLQWIIVAWIVRPLNILSSVTRKIVEEGDLTQVIDIHSRDEVGVLAEAFRQMVVQLRDVPRSLSQSVMLLSSVVGNLESATTEQSQTVAVQATALQETQVTAQEIKQTSQMAAQKAEEVLKSAAEAEAIGRSGETSVESSLQGLTDIRAQVDQISARILELDERTRQVGSITDTVKDLADQSNMLALNAAIEAVRSGEHGKGFGLVAREIRRLADQSIQATARVREILESISSSISQAVQITEKGSQRMEGGMVQVKASGENLRALAQMVRSSVESVRQIASAVSQQNSGISQIFTAVVDQTKMMDENVRRVEATTGAVKSLKAVANSLETVVKKFKV